MKFIPKSPARKFEVGTDVKIEMADCGALYLDADEQITFHTKQGGEYDIARKEWGFYATPSLNGRLSDFALRGVLVRNMRTTRYFVLLVETGKESEFLAYLAQENMKIISWMDRTEVLDDLAGKLKDSETVRRVSES